MPELPDVEGFRRVLAEHAAGPVVAGIDVLDRGVLHDVSVRRLRAAVRGRRFGEPRRHGKWLIAPLDDGVVVLIHFGMTGSLEWVTSGERHRHDRVVFRFDGGELRYRDMRKLTGLWLARDEDEVARVLADLGPDAADLSRDDLRAVLAPLHRQIKPALLDQTVLAGLGNLLADEALWRARINPRQRTDHIGRSGTGRLHARLDTVLHHSIDAGRVPGRAAWLTGHRDEPGGRCPRCHALLCHGRVGGRGTVWCPQCQPLR